MRAIVTAALLVFAADVDGAIAYDLDLFEERCLDHDLAPRLRAAYCKVVAAQSDDPGTVARAFARRGRLLAEALQQPEAALANYDQMVAAQPDNVFALVLRARLRSKQYQTEGAIEDLTRAIDLDPDDIEIWLERAQIHAEDYEPEKAEADYRAAAKVDPDDPRPYNRMAMLKADAGDYRAAVDLFEKALDLQPGDPVLFANRGAMLLELGRYEEALADYRAVVRLGEADAATHAQLARLYRQGAAGERDLEKAAEHARLAEEMAPEIYDLAILRGDILSEDGQPEAAVAAHRRGLDAGPEMVPAYKESLRKQGYFEGPPEDGTDAAFWQALEACIRDGCVVFPEVTP